MGERPAPRPGKDPLFTDEDATEILDYIADEALTCSGCGLPKVDTMDPANEWAFRATTVACHACATKRRAEKALDVLDGVYSFVFPLAATIAPARNSTAPTPPRANDAS